MTWPGEVLALGWRNVPQLVAVTAMQHCSYIKLPRGTRAIWASRWRCSSAEERDGWQMAGRDRRTRARRPAVRSRDTVCRGDDHHIATDSAAYAADTSTGQSRHFLDRVSILENKLPLIEDRGQTDRVTILANSNPVCNPWPWSL